MGADTVALLQIGHAEHIEGLVAKRHLGVLVHQLLEQADAFFHIGARQDRLLEDFIALEGLKILFVFLHLLLKERRGLALVELGELQQHGGDKIAVGIFLQQGLVLDNDTVQLGEVLAALADDSGDDRSRLLRCIRHRSGRGPREHGVHQEGGVQQERAVQQEHSGPKERAWSGKEAARPGAAVSGHALMFRLLLHIDSRGLFTG